ncbi:MAG: mercuric reductase [Anaerolineales bacterium]|nr:mercuric reductase [Anaerolineales bacterium]
MNINELLTVQDEHNDKLIQNARPPEWQNPTPHGRYNMVVIGAGSAGLVAVAGTAGIGGKVALIEKNLMGGDCLNYGCVPSKTIIRSGRAVADVRDAARFGVHVPEGTTVDFGEVMARMRRVRADISPHDSAERYTNLGADVYFGEARFTGPDTVEVGGQTLHFSKAVIATGSRASFIPIPGLAESGYLTNEDVFNLTEQPRRLAVIGGGPIGSELAQTFQRLGTAVTLIDIAEHILPREDPDAAAIVQASLLKDGVTLLLGVKTQKVRVDGAEKVIEYEEHGRVHEIRVDDILLAVGRRPNIEGLDLEKAGVEYSKKGITVNDQLQTSNPRIYGAGDVAVPYQFTHVAGQTAAIVVQNALFPFPKRKFSDLIIPWVTYTDPEVAHVGLYPAQAAEQGIEIDTFSADMGKNDRAMAEGSTEGFVKIHVKKGTSKILGATIVGRHAGEMLNEITLAMKHDLGMGALHGLIHPYPTEAEAIAKAASEWNKTRLTPLVAKIFGWWLQRTR